MIRRLEEAIDQLRALPENDQEQVAVVLMAFASARTTCDRCDE